MNRRAVVLRVQPLSSVVELCFIGSLNALRIFADILRIIPVSSPLPGVHISMHFFAALMDVVCVTRYQ